MFDIKKSSKSHIDADEQFIVVRDAVVYLRILGREGEYTILTATAAEDSGGIVAFNDLEILINAALRVADKLNIRREVKYDHDQRPYASLGKWEYLSDAFRVAEGLFVELDLNQ